MKWHGHVLDLGSTKWRFLWSRELNPAPNTIKISRSKLELPNIWLHNIKIKTSAWTDHWGTPGSGISTRLLDQMVIPVIGSILIPLKALV
ncbi:hypothetical protein N7462_008983 [Penicillium macrosclerotiorum]|uniref:uncharacterized protein n=1 Tax=Penicillium macrosclerotiorum TaxID=303699 RepID=UPI0025499499|nr:uncharacterized protein N7462_008983 [Penicillium macrosclerotiorum]KAJ5676086.1 hypothetical protein N7462_008983 [Penicillium macrosclerotiorum]